MLTTDSPEFLRFGFKIEGDVQEVRDYLNTLTLPETGNKYVASDHIFEAIPLINKLGKQYFKEFQGGYTCGDNALLNCAEYHACPEINIAEDDVTLFLGTLNDIKDHKIDSSSFKELLLKKGEIILIYPGVLHFSPCRVGKKKFKVACLLERGTNLDLKEPSNDPTLWKVNKWLIAHQDSKQASMGAYIGIIGKNRNGSLAE